MRFLRSLDAVPAIVAYLVASLVANFIEGLHAIDQRHLRMDYIGCSYMMQGISNLALFSVVLWFSDSLVLACISMARLHAGNLRYLRYAAGLWL